jgi:hypothetical protein
MRHGPATNDRLDDAADGPRFAPLEIDSYEQLARNEPEILRRLRALPNGPWLVLLDAPRALRDGGVHLSAEAIREWARREGPHLFRRNGRETAYDAVARAVGPSRSTITLNGLLRKTERPS